jgi:hypothetical protein
MDSEKHASLSAIDTLKLLDFSHVREQIWDVLKLPEEPANVLGTSDIHQSVGLRI